MKISRRKFLAAAPIAAGVALQLNGSVFGQQARVGVDVLSGLNWNTFYPYVNTLFKFSDAAGDPVDLRLTNMIDLVPLTPGMTPKNGECFTLVFSGPSSHPLKQDVYRVEHFALGNFDLLITVGTEGRRSVSYAAIINRMVAL